MTATRQNDPLGTQAARLGAGLTSPGALGRGRTVAWVLVAYAGLGVGAAALSAIVGQSPIGCRGWLRMPPIAGLLCSLGGGLCITALTLVATRTLVERTAWARALHAALRPAVHGSEDRWLIAMALASGVAEELLFRGLLVPWLGVLPPALLFGALHQIRGRARWGWMGWATAMGVVFGALYAATGSLAGPVLAHAAINGANLRFLRDNDPDPRPRALGGLLRGHPSSGQQAP